MTYDHFRRTLDTIADRGQRIDLWWRDDDAVTPTPALDQLRDLAGKYHVPVTLAVIPNLTGAALARHLSPDQDHIKIAVHGWSHENHAPTGQKKSELGPDRPAQVVLAELAQGISKLQTLYGGQCLNLLVPPWNRISPDVVAGLSDIGFQALSTFGAEPRTDELSWINTHIDPIDWHGTHSLLPPDALWAQCAARANLIAEQGGTMGVLTHHLVHDAAIWGFVENILALTSGHAACRWVTPDQVIPKLTHG